MRLFVERIFVEPGWDGKLWVHVQFNDESVWTPGLVEQALIIQKVVFCEEAKYLNLDHEAYLLPIEFLTRAMKGENVCVLASENKFNLTHTRAYKKFCLNKPNKDNK